MKILLVAAAAACISTGAQSCEAHDTAHSHAVQHVAANDGKSAQSGTIRVEAPWSRATPGGATVGAGYLVVRNAGSAPDRLIGGTTGIAQRVEVHEMSMDNGVMRMRALPRGLDIPAGGQAELRPGGYHIMFMGLSNALKEGESFPVTLQFERAGAVQVQFNVRGMGASGPGETSGHSHQHQHQHRH